MPVAATSDAVSQSVNTCTTGDWASSSLAFAISRGPCTATPSAPSQRSALSRHATFPFSFHIQVGRVAQRSPPSEPLPPAGAIQRRVKRRTLSAYTAPIARPAGVRPKRQWANSRGERREASAISSRARCWRRRSRLYLRMAQRTR
jgi:hypothetical protein